MHIVIKDTLKGVGVGTAVGLGAKVLGRTAARTVSVVGWGVTAYSGMKTLATYLKNDPHNQLVAPLKEEQEKWGSAISSIGRDPYHAENEYSILDGG